jgi:hypothetical protein
LFGVQPLILSSRSRLAVIWKQSFSSISCLDSLLSVQKETAMIEERLLITLLLLIACLLAGRQKQETIIEENS